MGIEVNVNARFLELAKQCGTWSGQSLELNQEGIDKFAQLIIQEVLLCLEPDLYQSKIEYEFEQTFYLRCERIIKKYFELRNV
jgi:hypothetical protein